MLQIEIFQQDSSIYQARSTNEDMNMEFNYDFSLKEDPNNKVIIIDYIILL